MDLASFTRKLEPVVADRFGPALERAYEYVDRLCLELCLGVARDGWLASQPVAHARYFVQAVLDILAEEGYPAPTCKGLSVQEEARRACPEARPVFELIERCHVHAHGFIRGEVSGLEVVFPRGDLSLWERVHSNDRVMSIYADLVDAAMAAVVTPDRRILELGAGTGAVLARSLATLHEARIAEYWFTDVGQVFLFQAARRYAQVPWLRFAKLDIDAPLVDQGAARGSFDMVLAVNVLHVANDICATLRDVHSLLRPGGCLLLGEGSPPELSRRWRLDLVFGFLDAWSGFLLPTQWRETLAECGFHPVWTIPGEQWFRGPCRGGLIVAHKPDACPT